MKVILGVDSDGQYRQSLKLLARLRLPHLHLIMIHVRREEDERDDSLMADAAKFSYNLGLHANEYTEQGDPATVLSTLARLENADIVAIGSGEKGPLNVLLNGSVGKDLMTSWAGSILIAKGQVDSYGSLRAVLGYDEGQHSRDGLKTLVSWRPEGIRHIEVVTVELPLVAEFQALRVTHEAAIGTTIMEATQTASDIAASAARDLNAAGLVASSKGVFGDIVPELGREMASTVSDLLIIPAQRHTLFERLFFGSISMAEAMNEPHSMLVIR